MPTIDQLSSTTTLTASDKLVVYSQDNGDTRKATLSTLLNFLHENFQEEGLVTQVTVPLTGQNIILGTQTKNLWLVLNPAGSIASLTVTLPPSTSAFDGQELSVSTSQGITTFSVSGNGATVLGAPTSLAANSFFTLKYNTTQNSWYSTNQGVPNSFGTVTITNGINDANNNELVKFTATASAVNEITITNAATGNDPSIAATGDNANIDLNLLGKGSGTVHVAGVPVVTTTGVQTLTNKTLSAPTFSGATTGSVFPAVDGSQSLGTNGARWDAYTKNVTTNIATFKTPDPVDSKTTARTNEIVQRNVPKAWGTARGNGAGTIIFDEGFNVASIVSDGNSALVTLAVEMANENYAVIAMANQAAATYTYYVSSKTKPTFKINCYNHFGDVPVNIGADNVQFGFVVFGLQ